MNMRFELNSTCHPIQKKLSATYLRLYFLTKISPTTFVSFFYYNNQNLVIKKKNYKNKMLKRFIMYMG